MAKVFKILIATFLLAVCSMNISIGQEAPSIEDQENNLEKAEGNERAEILNALSKAYLTVDISKSISYGKQAESYSKKIGSDSQLATAYHNLGRAYRAKSDQTLSITYFRKAFKLRQEIKDFKGINQTSINIGTYYLNLGKNREALDYYKKALKAGEEAGYKKGIGIAHNQIGNVLNFNCEYENAIKHYQESLYIFEELGFDNGVASSLSNIGFIYQNLDKKDEALRYFRKALNFYQERNYPKGIGEALNNCGNIFGQLETENANEVVNLDSAIYYFNQALEQFHIANYKQGIISATTNLGLSYMYGKEYKTALNFLDQALELNKEVNNKYELSSIYKAIGITYRGLHKYNQALIYFKKGLKTSEELGFTEHIMMNNRYISAVHDSMGNYKTSLEHLKTYINLNEEVRGDKMKKVIQEMETKYETEKKEQQIREVSQKNEYQKRVIYGAAIGGAIIFIFAVLMLIQFVQKRKANLLLLEKNEEILLQKEEIETQRDEIEAQKDQVELQKDLIEDQQRGIMDSIHYARRIQEAILPQREFIDEINSESFVLFKPRDVVSGDFYWMGQKGTKNIIIAADCTGHGVPGAFMSMLGTAFLNEITGTKDDISSDAILNALRNHVIISLKQTGKQGEQKDGMDLALYQYDSETLDMQFAGANNPLFVIRKTDLHQVKTDHKRINEEELINEDTGENYTLIQFKADKMPIGIYSDFKPFESIDFKLQPGDSIYTFSDGYVDQFGGPKGKKYLTKRFKRKLISIQHENMQSQKKMLNEEIEAWKGDTEQIDDIIVIGLRV